MKTTSLLAVLSASSLAYGAVFRRDAATIVNDISIISAGSQKVLDDVNAYQGGSNGVNAAVQINTDSNTLNAEIQNGTTDAKASSVLSDADSALVANAVTGLQPVVYALLQALTDKKPKFEAASLGFSAIGIVFGALTSQRQSTTDFGSNVTAKLSPTIARLSPLLTNNIDFHFVRAIQAFSTDN